MGEARRKKLAGTEAEGTWPFVRLWADAMDAGVAHAGNRHLQR